MFYLGRIFKLNLESRGMFAEKKKKKKLYLTPNRQMYNASHIRYKIKAIYTHAHEWIHGHKHSS